MTTTTTELDERSLAEELVGKSIIKVAGDTLVLNDGTELHVQGTSDCCAWYEASVRTINLSDNIVTDVRLDERNAGSLDDAYTLTVLSSSNELLAVDVEGYEGSGYYVHAAELRIVKKENA